MPSLDNKPMNRPTCATCLRAQSTCICRWITPTPHSVNVLILQHPMEVHQAKGSARLLHLSLPRSQLLVGETFDTTDLQTRLAAAHAVLLYPSTPAQATLAQATQTHSCQVQASQPKDAPQLATMLPADTGQLCLVVLDATWRKSRKMLHCNPLLQQLPRLSLQDLPAPRYSIRKAHRHEQRSTLEATCAALALLEGRAAPYAPLLAAFDGFVAQQLIYSQR